MVKDLHRNKELGAGLNKWRGGAGIRESRMILSIICRPLSTEAHLARLMPQSATDGLMSDLHQFQIYGDYFEHVHFFGPSRV